MLRINGSMTYRQELETLLTEKTTRLNELKELERQIPAGVSSITLDGFSTAIDRDLLLKEMQQVETDIADIKSILNSRQRFRAVNLGTYY